MDSLWALIPCPHGEQVHARCMLDRPERPASGHADPQSCVACRSEWPARNRPLHPAELAEDLRRRRPGGRWPAVAGALQFAELLEEDGPRLDPARYVTIGSHDTFEEMVRTHGSSQPPHSCCAPCSAMLLAYPKAPTLTFPDRGNGERQPVTAVISSPRTASARRILYSDSRIEGSTSYLMS